MSRSLADVRAEYDRLDARCGADTRSIVLKVSARTVKRLGCFSPGTPPCITLSAAVLADETLFWDTIRHEYAHALVWLNDPVTQHGHDAVWKAACRMVGCAPRATVKADTSLQTLREQSARWRLCCSVCGLETFYLREGKIVRLIRAGQGKRITCTNCGGHSFELTELRPDAAR